MILNMVISNQNISFNEFIFIHLDKAKIQFYLAFPQ